MATNNKLNIMQRWIASQPADNLLSVASDIMLAECDGTLASEIACRQKFMQQQIDMTDKLYQVFLDILSANHALDLGFHPDDEPQSITKTWYEGNAFTTKACDQYNNMLNMISNSYRDCGVPDRIYDFVVEYKDNINACRGLPADGVMTELGLDDIKID